MIIGITGTNGAGKGAAVDYLVSKGFAHYSGRAFITEEIQKRGLSIDRDALREVGDDLRKTHAPTYILEQMYSRAVARGGDAVIESIREIGAVDFLKQRYAYLLAIDADRSIRYERTVQRGSETDQVDFDTWVEQEEKEWHNSAAHELNVPGVMKRADYTIRNEGTLKELHNKVDAFLEQIKK